MNRPVLDIVTRHLRSPNRAELLARQQASLVPLQGDWVQSVLIDPYGTKGIAGANFRFHSFEPAADYVWMLDDDDVCLEPDLLAYIDRDADLTILRVRYCDQSLLPTREYFRDQQLCYGHITVQCAIMTRELWLAHRTAWGLYYEGDYKFLAAAKAGAQRVAWVDRVIAALDVHRMGEP